MTDKQAAQTDTDSRLDWSRLSLKPSRAPVRGRWYAANTREPIRDETLRNGLITFGAVIQRQGLATTSASPRYALQAGFAALFDPELTGHALNEAIEKWQQRHLSTSALARIKLVRRAAVETGEGLIVHFPNGETRRLAPGPSSVITKAVIEDFTSRFLMNPAVLWLSESAAKENWRDSELARDLGLRIETDRNLPDIILVDLGPLKPLFVFVEVVASDGPINEERRNALLKLILDAGYEPSQAAFVTAYHDRDHPAFRKTFATLAWQSFAWCVSEPDGLIGLRIPDTERHLAELLA